MLKMPTRVGGIRAKITVTIIRLESKSSRMWAPALVRLGNTNARVANASYAGYSFSSLPPFSNSGSTRSNNPFSNCCTSSGSYVAPTSRAR